MLAEKGEVPDEEYLLPIGKANVERQGADVTIVSYGRPLQRVVRPAVASTCSRITASMSN